MAKKVNYTSNLTCLVIRIRCLKESLKLPADGELFGEFLDRELHFLAVTLGRIHRALQASSFTQDRLQLVIDLKHIAVLLSDVLEGMLQRRFPIARYLEAHSARYARLLNHLRIAIAELEGQLSEMSGRPGDGTFIVSEEEFMHLLSSGDEEES
jgi:hypothetical protein